MRFLTFVIFFFLLADVYAQDKVSRTREETSVRSFFADFNATVSSLKNSNNTNLNGKGIELQLNYAFVDKSALGIGIKQMVLGSSGSATSLSFRYTYAFLGNLNRQVEKTFLDDGLIMERKTAETACLCFQLIGAQYYLNATSTTVPFTGFGGALYFKYPSFELFSLMSGLSYERLTNVTNLNILTFFLGVEFRI